MKNLTLETPEAARAMRAALEAAVSRPAPRRKFWQSQRDSAVVQRMDHWAVQMRDILSQNRFPQRFPLWTKDDEHAIQRGLQDIPDGLRDGICIQ